ncbi:unnamed protein product [Hydatigera taeniaeformis]|uniref:Uncharacterized protein n=1 Tax=Hydatigena taeniaeformis TaxID=6205 RepID=A0A0R3WVF6_HYDTA|nr:unnamed protein product [Hydatigera taeniaeformis]
MKSRSFACNLELLRGTSGECCFEEARGDVWFQSQSTSPIDEVRSALGCVSSRSELPLEALLMRRYALRLMARSKLLLP